MHFNIKKSDFQTTINGKKTDLFFLENKQGMCVAVTNYGGRIAGILVPDKNGKPTDVVAGFDSIDKFLKSTEAFYGALIGRYCNRIAKGKFTLDGKTFSLPVNNGPNSLHGGTPGFHAVVWDATQIDDTTLELSYLSPDGEAGYPGNLTVKATYTLGENNDLKICYEAATDRKTIVNLTNHAFFNLNGEGSGNVLEHLLQINADCFTPIDETSIPTGELRSVKGTAFDFLQPKTIGKCISNDEEQLKMGNGYDHNYVLNSKNDGSLFLAGTAVGEKSGIVLEVYTTEPGMQLYTGNFMSGNNTFKCGAKDDVRTTFCLETQHYPDSPNQSGFPSTVLDAGKVFQSCSVYKFSVK